MIYIVYSVVNSTRVAGRYRYKKRPSVLHSFLPQVCGKVDFGKHQRRTGLQVTCFNSLSCEFNFSRPNGLFLKSTSSRLVSS